jgi:hypothetical protein
MQINDLPSTKPARKHFVVVLKRLTLAHSGPKRTAHLWHTGGGELPINRKNTPFVDTIAFPNTYASYTAEAVVCFIQQP